MDSAALIIRPRRFKISSANATMRKLGEAVGEAACVFEDEGVVQEEERLRGSRRSSQGG